MTAPLRGGEIDACVHRIVLSRAGPLEAERTPLSPELARRRREAESHRRVVLDELRALHPGAVTSSGHQHTAELLAKGVELILQPRLADVPTARRSASVQAFVRVGRTDSGFCYSPLVVKNHEVTEPASTRRLSEGTLSRLVPGEVEVREGLGLRATPTVRRDGLLLAGATRILQACGAADPNTRGVLIDRGSRVWWLDLSAGSRYNLAAYDALYEERRLVLEVLDRWFESGGDLPTKPYWHRDCLTCEFSEHCEEQLERSDDVSLTRFTSVEQQRALRAQGIDTRAKLARLDPLRAVRARGKALAVDLAFEDEDALSKALDKLDDLIYRARAHVRASALRILDPSQMGCPTADVEVDVDMESYDDATYLWGASVTVNSPVDGVAPGHRTFVEWGELDENAEARVFASFWAWFSELRRTCHHQDRSFAAYCFWAQAEDGAMSRAVATPVDGGPTLEDVEAFRSTPGHWIDLHDLAKSQIQTEGPLGLKQLAQSAGFTWRDANPSGEASMLWYEVASRDDSLEALTSRQRILEYNEDDCRATKALRDWLNGPAQTLAHRDDPL